MPSHTYWRCCALMEWPAHKALFHQQDLNKILEIFLNHCHQSPGQQGAALCAGYIRLFSRDFLWRQKQKGPYLLTGCFNDYYVTVHTHIKLIIVDLNGIHNDVGNILLVEWGLWVAAELNCFYIFVCGDVYLTSKCTFPVFQTQDLQFDAGKSIFEFISGKITF